MWISHKSVSVVATGAVFTTGTRVLNMYNLGGNLIQKSVPGTTNSDLKEIV